MTREEAIKMLKEYAPRIKPFYEPQCTEYPQAIDMAIEALQREIPKNPVVNYMADSDGVRRSKVVEAVRCKECRHASECNKSVQYTRNELNTVTVGYSPIEWCSRGERKKP